MFIVKGEEDNKIQGLEVGVDDYIIKLFLFCELVVCLKVVLCCIGFGDSEVLIEVGGLLLDLISYCVIIDGKLVEMGFIEYCLLQFFMIYQECVYICG